MTDRKNIIVSRLNQPIVLVGLMATGKTRLGRMLARALELEFTDTDHEISTAAGLTVAEIFEKYGEEEFRNRESALVRQLLEGNRHVSVISTGGGTPMRTENADLIFGSALSIWLRTEIPVILSRAGEENCRPLLKNGNPEKTLRDMVDLRYPVYQRAVLTIDTDKGTASDVLQDILDGIEGIAGA